MSAALSPLQICPFSGGKFRFSPSPIPCFNSLPVQARLGLLFLLLPFFFPPVLSPAWIGLVSSHPGSPLSRIRPQLPHTPPTGSVWGFAGVASLLDLQKRTQGHTGASLVFLLQNKFTPPPKGGGAGHRLSWVCWSFPAEKPGAFPQEKTDTSYPMTSLAVACGNCWSQTVHTAPTGPV